MLEDVSAQVAKLLLMPRRDLELPAEDGFRMMAMAGNLSAAKVSRKPCQMTFRFYKRSRKLLDRDPLFRLR